MEDENNVKEECVCGSTHFMQEDGKTFCMECQTELESAKEIVYEVNDFGPEIGDLTQRSRVLTTTVKKQAGTKRLYLFRQEPSTHQRIFHLQSSRRNCQRHGNV